MGQFNVFHNNLTASLFKVSSSLVAKEPFLFNDSFQANINQREPIVCCPDFSI